MSFIFFFLMIRRPPRSTQSRSSAASDVYKRQGLGHLAEELAHRGAALFVGDRGVGPGPRGILRVVPDGIAVSLTRDLDPRDRGFLLRVEGRPAVEWLDAKDHLHPRVVVHRRP